MCINFFIITLFKYFYYYFEIYILYSTLYTVIQSIFLEQCSDSIKLIKGKFSINLRLIELNWRPRISFEPTKIINKIKNNLEVIF